MTERTRLARQPPVTHGSGATSHAVPEQEDTMAASPGTEMKRTLTMTGLTINAMALIAPGAFLWTTFQAQVVQQNGGATTAYDMLPGCLLYTSPSPRDGLLSRMPS